MDHGKIIRLSDRGLLTDRQRAKIAAEIEERFKEAFRFTRHNSTVEQRSMFQLNLWRQGMPVHNDIDNECCPDFSCCCGPLRMASERLRNMFCDDPASRPAMLRDWFQALPAPDKILYDVPGQHVFRLEPK